MIKLKKALKFISDEEYRWRILSKRGRYDKMPDEEYIRKSFKLIMKTELDLDSPKTFNEKLQWIKLYDRKHEYTKMVDKYESKLYVAQRIGEEHIIPTYGVWDSFDEIDFDSLPRQFVLKCTHDSGGLVVCRDKTKLDKESAKKKIEKSLKTNFYYRHREWPYKDVKPRILAEAYMEQEELKESGIAGLVDYKFYCFNGEPRFLYVSQGLENHNTATISFLSLDWKFLKYERSDFKPLSELPRKPDNLDQMIEFTKVLSEGIDFIRVDLYEINGKAYFSELTFFPCGGLMPFRNPEHDLEVGNMLTLTSKKN